MKEDKLSDLSMQLSVDVLKLTKDYNPPEKKKKPQNKYINLIKKKRKF